MAEPMQQKTTEASVRMGIRGISVLVMIIAVVGLYGWLGDYYQLRSIFSWTVSMKANTALGLLLAGSCCLLLSQQQDVPYWQWLGKGLALLVVLLGGITTAQYVLGFNAGIDQLLLTAPVNEVLSPYPGRMSLMSALSFLLLGSALLLLEKPRAWSAVQLLALIVLLLALLAFVYYLLGNVAFLAADKFSGMAIHTAFAFILLAVCCLALTAKGGYVLRWRHYWFHVSMALALSLIAISAGTVLYNLINKNPLIHQVGVSHRLTVEVLNLASLLEQLAIPQEEQALRHLLVALDPSLDNALRILQANPFSNNPPLLLLLQTELQRLQIMRDDWLQSERLIKVQLQQPGVGNKLHQLKQLILQYASSNDKQLQQDLLRFDQAARTVGVASILALLLATAMLLWIFSALRREVSERKHKEGLAKMREQEFNALAEAMPQIVWVADSARYFHYFNQYWLRYSGLDMESSRMVGWLFRCHPDDMEQASGVFDRAIEEKSEFELECRLADMDGQYRWWLVRAVHRFDLLEGSDRWFGCCTDIDQLKQQSAELLQAKQQLALSDRSKALFVSSISEEMARPMEALINLSDLSLSYRLPTVVRNQITETYTSLNSLLDESATRRNDTLHNGFVR